MVKLLKKYKEFILYGIFGILTTLVNIIVYYLVTRVFGIGEYVSNVIAWILSVLFAFVTNKLYVFDSQDHSSKVILKEASSFFGFRLLSLVFDMGSMYVMLSVLNWNDLLSKIIANIIVIILNYIFSKVFVFRKTEKR